MLISEYFDESMVLLAKELCWPLEYVKSLKIDQRKSSYKVDLSKEESMTLNKWQKGDMLLYNHFKTIFEKKINTYGANKMKRSLKKLQNLNKKVSEDCVLGVSDNEQWNNEYTEQKTYRNLEKYIFVFLICHALYHKMQVILKR